MDSGKIVDPYYVVEMPSSVVVMAITDDNKVVLVKQYRHPVNQVLLELPGGFMDEKEEPQQTISREINTGKITSAKELSHEKNN